MFVPKEQLTNEAKVWIYPSSRKFYPQEMEGLQKSLRDFVNNWKEKEEIFKASFEVVYDRFIIFFAESDLPLSNADIDTQVGFILELQAAYKVELLDRMNVCFKQGDYVQYKEVKAFKKMLKDKSVSPKTIVFDNLVQTKEELNDFWEVPITESWYSRFL